MTQYDRTGYDRTGYMDITQTAEYRAELAAQQTFMARVFGWMAIGLLTTAAVALVISVVNPTLIADMGNGIFIILLAKLGIAWAMGLMLNRVSAAVLKAMFLVYATTTGLVFSILFLIYTDASIYATFFVTAGMFGAVAIWGYTTKKDLSGWGTFLFMALIGLILSMIVSMFFPNPMLTFLISIAGVIIFTGLTAYDVQKIKQAYADAPEGSDKLRKLAVYGAFILYLDFINLFLHLLRLLGRRR
ncbi:MAG: Bax inhibitor-1/YccA family protein [Phycisphaerales bacterium]|nr:Bax inhibitor-1/YccA family protein [Phycisphaerales bacterium]